MKPSKVTVEKIPTSYHIFFVWVKSGVKPSIIQWMEKERFGTETLTKNRDSQVK